VTAAPVLTGFARAGARRLTRPLLRVPLFAKLVGANAIVVFIAALVLSGPIARFAPGTTAYDYLVILSLSAGTLINVWLMKIALEPIHDLQRVAKRVSEGALNERVTQTPLADRKLSHLIDTTNEMLNRLAADRDRMRKLGAEVVYAQEEERAHAARDLHDSVAQILTAASLETTALINAGPSGVPPAKLIAIRDLLQRAIEEVRGVSQALHPRVASDLGLASALQSLASTTRERSLIDVRVMTDVDAEGIPSALAATLYRVAKESLRNIEQRAEASSASIHLSANGGVLELVVTDDGGFDERTEPLASRSLSLKAARERLSLAGGEMHIDRAPNGGTRIVARINNTQRIA